MIEFRQKTCQAVADALNAICEDCNGCAGKLRAELWGECACQRRSFDALMKMNHETLALMAKETT